MGVKWKGGNPDDLIRGLEQRRRELPIMVAAVVTETVQEAQKVQREYLDRATTPYGELRFSQGRGRSAGRNDTGTMMDGIGWEVERASKNRIVGRWGWLSGILDYFVYQEKGIGVPEAHSLLDSYIEISQKFQARMKGMFRG
jgi:hypothetical protein